MIELLESSLIYRNPKPYLRARNAWHPTLLALDKSTLLCSFDIGVGAESLDYRTYLARSEDGGQSWSEPRQIFEDAVQPSTHTLRLCRLSDGTLLAIGARFHRPDAEEGISNRANSGMTPMDVITLSSNDDGATWSTPRVVKPPLAGPGFEICHSVIELRDGRLLWPTSTWRGWDGELPNGWKAVAFVSHDKGETWPEYLDEMQSDDDIAYWEQSLIQMPDETLAAIGWAFHEPSGTSRPNVFTTSADGTHFAPLQPTGLIGETAKIVSLGEGRVLCVYRRSDEPGLWGALCEIEASRWTIIEQAPLWSGAASGMTGEGSNSDNLVELKFGFPSLARVAEDEVLIAFWCCEDAVFNIRQLRCRVSGC